MKTFKLILILLFTTIFIVFALQNMVDLTINFLMWKLTLPVFVSSIAIYFFGAITGGLLFSLLQKITRTTEPRDKGY
jgi:uncharacterized integral membrane protein